MTNRTFFLSLALVLGAGGLPATAHACAMHQTALRAARSCCAAAPDRACAIACANAHRSQQSALRAPAPESTLTTCLNFPASHDLAAPVILLASAGSSTDTSPAPVPRRYLRLRTLRL